MLTPATATLLRIVVIAVLLAAQRQVTPDVHCHKAGSGSWFGHSTSHHLLQILLSGLTDRMPIQIRVTPGCVIITIQNTRKLYGCAETLGVAGVNRIKMLQ
ncbi:hypothetical protein A3N42_14550 [Klebsiella aerogenes]|nr:hypothetical protein A3N42_14550 [Klebsiella aerogenes]